MKLYINNERGNIRIGKIKLNDESISINIENITDIIIQIVANNENHTEKTKLLHTKYTLPCLFIIYANRHGYFANVFFLKEKSYPKQICKDKKIITSYDIKETIICGNSLYNIGTIRKKEDLINKIKSYCSIGQIIKDFC